MWAGRLVVITACLAAACLSHGSACGQNDWQFPDPYFGAIELDVSRPTAQRPRRVEPVPSPRPKTMRQRPYRSRQRWSTQGVRP